MLAQGRGIVDVGDGQGLNPLLQYWTMVIHPPMLYLGYVGFTVPFAFAMASLITQAAGRSLDPHHAPLDDRHLVLPEHRHPARRRLGVRGPRLGRLLGLGSGGERFAAAVADGTAFLHSVMMQEKKGMMKVWNMVLVAATFFLCIFGTTLTRSGIVQFRSRLRAVADRQVFRLVPGARHRGHDLPDSRPAGLSEERSAAGKRGFARIQLPVQ